MQEIIRQIRSFLMLNIMIKTEVHSFNMKVLFLKVIWYKCDGVIC